MGVARDTWVQPRSASKAQDATKGRLCAVIGAVGDPHLNKLAEGIQEEHKKCNLPAGCLLKVFHFLRPAKKQPCRHMVVNGLLESAGGTHSAWCERLLTQGGSGSHDTPHLANARRLRNAYAARERSNRGGSPWDGQVVQQEVNLDWDSSRAMTADLCPRAACTSKHVMWRSVVWKMQRLVGPGGLALQEALLSVRLRPQIHVGIIKGQSGY